MNSPSMEVNSEENPFEGLGELVADSIVNSDKYTPEQHADIEKMLQAAGDAVDPKTGFKRTLRMLIPIEGQRSTLSVNSREIASEINSNMAALQRRFK